MGRSEALSPRESLCFFEQARDPDQENGADDGDDDRANEAAGADAEGAQQPSSDHGADDAEDDIHDDAIAAAFHELPRSPTGDQTNHDPPNQVMHCEPPVLEFEIVPARTMGPKTAAERWSRGE